MEEKINRDLVEAGSIEDFDSISVGSSKERVVQCLRSLSDENPHFWASVKTISSESHVSEVYTRNVLNKLMNEGKIEQGRMNLKTYYRWTVPKTKKKSKEA